MMGCIFLLLFATGLFAQSSRKKVEKTRILFVMDASGSMYAMMDNDNRINVAKRLMNRIMDSLSHAKDVEVALRVYGHQSPPARHDCRDTRLEVPFRANNHNEIKKKVNGIVPKGTTLIAHALQEAANDFPKEPNVRNILILITDGIEECDGDPCAVSEALQSNGVILRPFIIGLGSTDEFRKAFECVGRYYDANTAADFDNVMNVVISQALNNTTAQVNLLDAYSKPTETNVNMTFYDMNSGQLVNNAMHTLNEKGNPDTMFIDPVYKYKLVVHTIPPVKKENIEVYAGKHTTIGLDAPQGNLLVKINGATNYNNLKCIIRLPNNPNTLHVMDANLGEKLIVGKYDVEVLTLPRMIQRNVEIKQSYTTTIELQQPGRLTVFALVQQYYADIYQMNRNELEWVHKIQIDNKTNSIIMQPGKYKIIYRPRNSYRSNQTFVREFTIQSGASTNITLN
jgi:Ca-activated chloride channel family protein